VCSQQPLTWHKDDGSAYTIASHAAARHHLRVEPWAAETGLPSELPIADGSTSIKVVGVTRVELTVPGHNKAVGVTVAVVDAMFCDFLLGRNALQMMEDLVLPTAVFCGHQCVDAAAVSATAAGTDGGAKAYLEAAFCAAKTTAQTTRVEVPAKAYFLIPETALVVDGKRVTSLSGMFAPDRVISTTNTVAAACAAVEATVDWSDSGKHGSCRRVSFLTELVAVVPKAPEKSFSLPVPSLAVSTWDALLSLRL
jgi:hypothetical protein